MHLCLTVHIIETADRISKGGRGGNVVGDALRPTHALLITLLAQSALTASYFNLSIQIAIGTPCKLVNERAQNFQFVALLIFPQQKYWTLGQIYKMLKQNPSKKGQIFSDSLGWQT